MLYNTQALVKMSKILLIIGIALVVAGALMFLADFLPVNLSNSNSEESYLKVVPNDSFSILSYRLHVLIIGIVLLAVFKLRDVIGF